MTQHCLTSSSKYLLSTMLLLLTESTLFFLELALASRTTSSPGSSSIVNWATHVANARQHGVTEQASTTSQSGSRLAPHRHVAHSRTTSAATSVSNYSRPVVTVCLLYHGIFLFLFLRHTHLLFGIYSYDWIQCLILLSPFNSSFIEL